MLWRDICRYGYVLVLCSGITFGLAYLAGVEPPSSIHAVVFAMGWSIIGAIRENNHD